MLFYFNTSKVKWSVAVWPVISVHNAVSKWSMKILDMAMTFNAFLFCVQNFKMVGLLFELYDHKMSNVLPYTIRMYDSRQDNQHYYPCSHYMSHRMFHKAEVVIMQVRVFIWLMLTGMSHRLTAVAAIQRLANQHLEPTSMNSTTYCKTSTLLNSWMIWADQQPLVWLPPYLLYKLAIYYVQIIVYSILYINF